MRMVLVPLFSKSGPSESAVFLEACSSAFESLSAVAQVRVLESLISGRGFSRDAGGAVVPLLNSLIPIASRTTELGAAGMSAMALLTANGHSFTAFLLRGVGPSVTDSHGVTDISAAALALGVVSAAGGGDVSMPLLDFRDRICLLATVFRSSGADRKLFHGDIVGLRMLATLGEEYDLFLQFLAAAVGWTSGGVLWNAVGGSGPLPEWASRPFTGVVEDDLQAVFCAIIGPINLRQMSLVEFYCYAALMLQINYVCKRIDVYSAGSPRLNVVSDVADVTYFDIARSVVVQCAQPDTAKAAGCFVTAVLQACTGVGSFVSSWACESLRQVADASCAATEDVMESGARVLALLDPLVGAWVLQHPRLRPHALNLHARMLSFELSITLDPVKPVGVDDPVDATVGVVEPVEYVLTESVLSHERGRRIVDTVLKSSGEGGAQVDRASISLTAILPMFTADGFLAQDVGMKNDEKLYVNAQIVSVGPAPPVEDARVDRSQAAISAISDDKTFIGLLLGLIASSDARLRDRAARLLMKLPTRCGWRFCLCGRPVGVYFFVRGVASVDFGCVRAVGQFYVTFWILARWTGAILSSLHQNPRATRPWRCTASRRVCVS